MAAWFGMMAPRLEAVPAARCGGGRSVRWAARRFLEPGGHDGPALASKKRSSDRRNVMYRAVVIGMASMLTIAMASAGLAEDHYPSRPAQIVVPFPPGGNTDILTRVMADQYSTALK